MMVTIIVAAPDVHVSNQWIEGWYNKWCHARGMDVHVSIGSIEWWWQ